ncbi:MAG: class I SAM-dependent methyltransferase [Victivallales bacterium]|nr:class I SAM-dependent methyltransferase [Victivallales bacterium]
MKHSVNAIPQRREEPPERWEPFERLASRYDAWFDIAGHRRIFEAEVACIRDLLGGVPRPWLEIGVGTGRFASALNLDEGIDPSPAALEYAAGRGIKTCSGKAENMPYDNHMFGLALMVVTLCFLDDPARALSECRRILRSDGFAILGFVPEDSAWGRFYMRKGSEGHPFYSAARFYTAKEVIRLANRAGFYLDRTTSCLSEKPGHELDSYEMHHEGIGKGSGFVAMRFALAKT